MTKTKEITVKILGKGEEKVKVDDAQTIEDLRSMLALDADVQAVDKDGKQISNSANASQASEINFVPNVEGGV